MAVSAGPVVVRRISARRWVLSLVTAILGSLAVLSLSAAPANAHAVLVGSSPIDGSRLDSSPTEVSLTFDEPVRLVTDAAEVIGDDGASVGSGPARVSPDGVTVTIPLRPHLSQGGYTATWRVISADTHVVAGSITFGVGQNAHAPPTLPESGDQSFAVWSDLADGVLYVGLVLCLGVFIVCRTLWKWTLALTRTRVLIWTGLSAIWVATTAQLGIAIESSGQSWVFVVARLLAATAVGALLDRILAARRPDTSRYATVAVVVVAAALATTVAATGHASAGPAAWLAVIATTAHLLAMSIWLGGLLSLCVIVLPTLHTDNLRRWSLTATCAVCVLMLTGIFQAWRQVRPLAALWSTDYGITLCVKVSAVAAMLALAYAARRRLSPTMLRRTVPLEAALGVAVIAITSVLVTQPPARTTYGPAVTITAPIVDGGHSEIRVDSTRRGPTSIQARLIGRGGQILAPRAVTAKLSSADANIAALPVEFVPDGTDWWRSSYATLPRAGSWTAQITFVFGPTDARVTAASFRVW